jgi:hypothetical protein
MDRLTDLSKTEKRRTFTLDRTSSMISEFIVKGFAAREWLEEVIGEKATEEDVYLALQDGTMLCKAVKKIKPELMKKYHENIKAEMKFKMVENM